MPKIGVFDSGIGGLSVANAIEKAMPNTEVVFVNDSEHVPYGTKQPAKLLSYVLPILLNLVEQGCDVIVIACNTVTTNLITDLRKKISIPLIGMEPMVKPAVEKTNSGVIAVCATPATLGSSRYHWLKDTYAKAVKVVEPDCSDWAGLIESKQIDRQHIHDQIDSVCEAGTDVIVLGCTHYHWIEDIVNEEAAGRAVVIHPEQAVIVQLDRVLRELEQPA